MEIDRSELVRDNRQISFQLEHAASRALAQKGLTGIQGHMLLYILAHSEGGTSLTDIHRDMGYSMAALSGIVKRLREKDYVRVEPCAQDDRRKLLFGTGKGEEVREFLDRAIAQAQEDVRRIQAQAQAQNQADRDAMLRSARREVAQLAVMAAAKVAQQELDARTDRAVAEQFLSEASEQK